MRIQISIVLFFLFVFIGKSQTVQIGTNTFSVVFEDDSLTSINKTIITKDVARVLAPFTNIVLRLKNELGRVNAKV